MSTNERCLNCGKGLIHFLDAANGYRGLCQLCLLQDNLRKNREAEQMTVSFNKETVKQDMVNHPPHYKDLSGVQCIEVTRNMGFSDGNCFKYLYRAGQKGDTLEDLKKRCGMPRTIEKAKIIYSRFTEHGRPKRKLRKSLEVVARLAGIESV